MNARRVKLLSAIIIVPVAMTLWIFFAPTKFGGSATYAVTDGISMQPLLHQGDLAIIRTQSSYHVGEVVLYKNQVIESEVLHRIVLVQDGHYFFKGDSNNFVDPGYATQSQLLGALWIDIPKIGGILDWLGRPLHAGSLGAVATFTFATTMLWPTRRKRRHRIKSLRHDRTFYPKSSDGSRTPTDNGTGLKLVMANQPLERAELSPLRRVAAVTVVFVGVFGLLSVLCVSISYSKSPNKVAPLVDAYSQSGTFSYSARAPSAPLVYPSGYATTGDPLYQNLVKTVDLEFQYRFKSALTHTVHGTFELKSVLYSQIDTWHRTFLLVPPQSFTGDTFTLKYAERLKILLDVLRHVSSSSGITEYAFAYDVMPVIHVSGVLHGRRIHQTFSPVLPFLVTRSSVSLNNSVAPIVSGATYVAPTAASTIAAILHPVQRGNVPHLVATTVPIARYNIPVVDLRRAGVLFGLLAVGVFLIDWLSRRRRSSLSDEVLVARRLHLLLVPVSSLRLFEGQLMIRIENFLDLAKLAKFLERPIFVEDQDGGRLYVIDDDAHRYTYQANGSTKSETSSFDHTEDDRHSTSHPTSATE